MTPEGYAGIIWKDRNRASEGAEIMKLESKELLKLGIVEKVIPETTPVTLDNIDEVCRTLKKEIFVFQK